uniref:Uncharacterized protein n=1 Tax=Setaria italica TaxID=4555 RepID=K3YKG0_SETIT
MQQDLKIGDLESDVELLKGKVNEEIELYRKNQETSLEKITFAKGAVAIVGLIPLFAHSWSMSIGSSVVNLQDGPANGANVKDRKRKTVKKNGHPS